MPKICRVDRNQPMIVEACIKLGATVQHLHAVGQGCPDLLVGYGGKNYLLEVKDPEQPPSKRGLTDPQKMWHKTWNGEVFIVKTTAEAVEILRNK